MTYEKVEQATKGIDLKEIYKISLGLDTWITRVRISKKEIENIREMLHKSIELTGIESKQTIQISQLLNQILNIYSK